MHPSRTTTARLIEAFEAQKKRGQYQHLSLLQSVQASARLCTKRNYHHHYRRQSPRFDVSALGLQHISHLSAGRINPSGVMSTGVPMENPSGRDPAPPAPPAPPPAPPRGPPCEAADAAAAAAAAAAAPLISLLCLARVRMSRSFRPMHQDPGK